MSTVALAQVVDQSKVASLNIAEFADEINKALASYEVKFQKGASLSKMVKASPLYQAKAKADQTTFMNEVKSVCKAYKLGEHVTLDLVLNQGYWIRYNGSLADKEGNMKQANVSILRGDIKASKEDGNIAAKLESAQVRATIDVKDEEIRFLKAQLAKATVVE